ncbi:PIH1D1 isoform 7, partial [Pan troglodytes]
RIPMSLGEPHAELDAKGQGCTAYDVAVNSDFYRRMQNSDFLRELVITIAREGLEDKYNLQLNPEHPLGAASSDPGAGGPVHARPRES